MKNYEQPANPIEVVNAETTGLTKLEYGALKAVPRLVDHWLNENVREATPDDIFDAVCNIVENILNECEKRQNGK